MSQSTPPLRFATPTGVPLLAAFDGGRLTSDGGLPWVAEAVTAPRWQELPDSLVLPRKTARSRYHRWRATAGNHEYEYCWSPVKRRHPRTEPMGLSA